jgi:hypothetical protein
VPQTSYNFGMAPGIAGQLADNNPKGLDTLLNKSGGTLAAGIAVKFGSTTPSGGSPPVGAPLPSQTNSFTGGGSDGNSATNLAASGDQIAGITVYTIATDPYNVAGVGLYREGVAMDVLTDGKIFVAAEQSVSPGDSVNVRFQAVAANTLIGAFTNTPDIGTRPVKGARWVTKSVSSSAVNLETTAQNIAILQFSALVDQATH